MKAASHISTLGYCRYWHPQRERPHLRLLALNLRLIKHIPHATHCSQQLCVELIVDF